MEDPKQESPEETARHVIANLISLRDDVSSEIPNEKVSGPPLRFKVQNNWFARIINALERGGGSDLFSDEASNTLIQFVEVFSHEDFKNKKWTAQSDIESGDMTIEIALDDLRDRYVHLFADEGA